MPDTVIIFSSNINILVSWKCGRLCKDTLVVLNTVILTALITDNTSLLSDITVDTIKWLIILIIYGIFFTLSPHQSTCLI